MDKPIKLPIYKIKINADDADESGVSYVALVDSPAIERTWMAYNNHLRFQADAERRIITGALMIADLPIYRRSESMGEFYVVFDKQEIEKIVQKFFRHSNTGNVNMMHSSEAKVNGVYMFESFIVDSSRGIKAPDGLNGITEGSWIGSYKVDNEEVWNNFIKTNEFTGFSVEGLFDMDLQSKTIEQEIVDIIEEIAQM